MKLSTIVLMFSCLSLSAYAYSQKITIQEKDASLEQILKKIGKQAGYYFFYEKGILEKTNKVTIRMRNASLEEVMKKCFENQSLIYNIVDRVIVIKEKPHLINRPAQKDSLKMNSIPVAIKISGYVTDDEETPLAGATITVKNTSTATVTDKNGFFTIESANKNAVLVITYVGYELKEVQPDGQTMLHIKLKPLNNNMENMVVIGYGTVRRKDLTGSVGEVKMEDLQKAPVKSFDDALAGRIAGVQVTSPDGQPGAAANIVIRGGNSVTQDNSPLYVIDGFPIDNPDNNALNPSDIESIEILKDASATAIYGARGANGVIIITTKRGKDGKSKVEYSGYGGFQNNITKVKSMNPYEFVRLQLELFPTSAPDLYTTGLGKTLEDYKNVQGIDWQDELFQKNAFMHNHNLSVSGGNKATKFSLSGSYFDQQGTIINSGFRRAQARFTLDHNVNSKFKVGLTANYSNMNAYGTKVSGGASSDLSLLYWAWCYRPINGSGNIDSLLNSLEDGDITSSTDYRFNPVKEAENELRNRISNVWNTNVYGEYALMPSLKLRVSAGIVNNILRAESFDNSQTRSANPRGATGQNGMNGSVIYTERSSYVNENTLTFNKTFQKTHRLTVLAGATVQGDANKRYGSAAIQVPNESLGINGLDEGTPYSITASATNNTLASLLGRVDYSYRSKYLATASLRADGSSKFNTDHKWAYFPSASVAWNFANEPFLGNTSFSEGKLRLSYGATGNNRVGDFAYLSALTRPIQYAYAPNNTLITGIVPSALGNANLKWETTIETNLGIDLGFWNQRVMLTADLYRKKTNDLLINAEIPLSSGYESVYKNIGKTENKGLELTITTVNFKKQNFSWNSSFNIAFNRSKVLALNDGQQEILTNVSWENTAGYGNVPAYIARIGQPVGMFYGLIWNGNYQYSDFNETSPGVYVLKDDVADNGTVRSQIQPGDIRYKDLDGNLTIDNNDRTVIGNPNPDFIGGFTNNIQFKNFDLNIFFQFVQGGDVLNANRIYFEGGIGNTRPGFNEFASYADRWTPDNPTNEYFRANGQGSLRAYSTRTIEDGSFVRLKTVALGYTLPANLLRRIKVQNARFYISAQNLYTWTKYKGNDPEVSTYDSPLTPAFDFSAYPRAKNIVAGISITL
ncbi:MAG: TonB-dependent receptor [Niabella sp.]